MPKFDEKHVKLCGGTIIWEEITTPTIISKGKNTGKQKWAVKVAFSASCPDLPIFNALYDTTLLNSKWRGVLPENGNKPVVPIKPGELNDQFSGGSRINFKTLYMPKIFDENGQMLDVMQYGPLIYTGQKIDILASCYDFDEVSKGIAAGLAGLAIIASAEAKHQDFGGVDAASAFGSASSHTVDEAAPVSNSPPPTQAHDYLPDAPGNTSPAPAPGPVAEVKYLTPSGGQYTEAELIAAKWSLEQIQALPRA